MCGNKVDDNDVFCKQCGAKVNLTGEINEVKPIKVEVVNESKSPYNKWVRVVSVIWGTLLLLSSIGSGIPYYFKSGLLLVLISEILVIPLSISLILLGLFPGDINNKVQIKNRYPEIIVGIIIVLIIIGTIEPQPLETWWNYNPNF
jgi:hypothetical protein